MLRKYLIFTFFLLLTAIPTFLAAQQHSFCGNTHFTRGDSLRGTLNEMRDWYDVTFYDLHVDVFPDKQSITGKNTFHFTTLESNNKLQFDLYDNLQIDSVLFEGKKMTYEREFNAVLVDLNKKLPIKSKVQLTVYFSGKPTVAKNPPWDGGFVWTKDERGKTWIGVACQGVGASIWWPNKDHQSDEPDSMRITGSVPSDLVLVSNGNFEGKKIDKKQGRSTYSWFVSYPINNYNVSLNIGNYTHFKDFYVSELSNDSLALDYYVLMHNKETARAHFEQVKPMFSCFEEYLGPYPFPKDGFALIETPYLGMEHQSGIAYGNNYQTGYAGIDYSGIGLDFDYIIVHETGHEWWGNSLTSHDIADMWIHEGFCTYSEALYVECLHGYETAMNYVNYQKTRIRNDRPMIGCYDVNYEGSSDMYAKGSVVLNTLRHVIDDDELWFNILKGLLKDYEHEIVTTDTIIQYINQKTGKDFNPFFDQYFRYTDIPTLSYKLEQVDENLKLTYQWLADAENFDMSIKYIGADNKKKTLYPTTIPKTLEIINMQAADFKFVESVYLANFVRN